MTGSHGRPVFLTDEDALAIHAEALLANGGEAGVRDLGLLQSAMAQPRAAFDGRHLHEDLFAMAAAYLFHLVQNHPFIDGNKRTGFLAMLAFLSLNGFEVANDTNEMAEMVLAVARGEIGKDGAAAMLRVMVEAQAGQTGPEGAPADP